MCYKLYTLFFAFSLIAHGGDLADSVQKKMSDYYLHLDFLPIAQNSDSSCPRVVIKNLTPRPLFINKESLWRDVGVRIKINYTTPLGHETESRILSRSTAINHEGFIRNSQVEPNGDLLIDACAHMSNFEALISRAVESTDNLDFDGIDSIVIRLLFDDLIVLSDSSVNVKNKPIITFYTEEYKFSGDELRVFLSSIVRVAKE